MSWDRFSYYLGKAIWNSVVVIITGVIIGALVYFGNQYMLSPNTATRNGLLIMMGVSFAFLIPFFCFREYAMGKYGNKYKK